RPGLDAVELGWTEVAAGELLAGVLQVLRPEQAPDALASNRLDHQRTAYVCHGAWIMSQRSRNQMQPRSRFRGGVYRGSVSVGLDGPHDIRIRCGAGDERNHDARDIAPRDDTGLRPGLES